MPHRPSTITTLPVLLTGLLLGVPVIARAQDLFESASLTPTTVTGGATSRGLVRLSSGPVERGFTVRLSSSNPAVAFVPPSVPVAPGVTLVFFDVATGAVAQSEDVFITISVGQYTEGSVRLTVLRPVPSNLTFTPFSVVGGNSTAGDVTLSGPAPSGGVLVDIDANGPALPYEQRPHSVTVPAGASRASFLIGTLPVARTTTLTMSVRAGDVTRTVQMNVGPPYPSSVTFQGSNFVGGQVRTGAVGLVAPAPAGGLVVALSSSSTVVVVPASVQVPAGATTASFTFTTASVLLPTAVSITATANSGSKTAQLTVNPLRPPA